MEVEATYWPMTCYGVEEINTSPLVTVSLKQGQQVGNMGQSTLKKRVIFLIDVSGSMKRSLKHVKASLMAFAELLDRYNSNHEFITSTSVDVDVVAFNDVITNIWPAETSFAHAVGQMKADGMTNMGDAIVKAFASVKDDEATWIAVLTDGVSNTGCAISLEAFTDLAKKRPRNVKMLSLGYGTHFDVDILTTLGTFIYLQDEEMIPSVMVSLFHEVMTSRHFVCVIEVIDIRGGTVASGKGALGMEVIGNRNVGVLSDPYAFGFIPSKKFTPDVYSIRIKCLASRWLLP